MNKLLIWRECAVQRGGGSLNGSSACPAGALGDRQVDKRPTVDRRWCMPWVGGREKGWEIDRLTKTASTHPHIPSTHMIPLLQKNPQLWGWRKGGGGWWSIYSWVTASRYEPQGETEFTLNGKWLYPVTSALVFPHVVISVSLNLSTSFSLCCWLSHGLLLTSAY